MKNANRKIGGILGILIILVLAAMFAGCTSDDNGDDEEEDKERSISISGSTTVLPIAEAAAKKWQDANSKDTITVSAGGSSTGVKNAGTGVSDIGMASRELKDSEKTEYKDLVQHVIAKDGIGIIIHKNNAVTSLTKAQVKDIYLGTITNWKDLGGADSEIVAVGRDTASGTRATFDELVLDDETPATTMQEKQSNGQVHETVKGNPNAIGYVGLGYVDAEVKGVKVDGVAPSVATVQSGAYPISRNLNMFTKGQPTGLALDFLNYLKGSEGQKIVEDEGFVPIA